MPTLDISDSANIDLVEIWLFIARDNIERADQLIARIHETFSLLLQNPSLGRRRDDLAPELRSFPVDHHLVFYRQTEDGIKVARVVSGHRDLSALFD